MQLKQLMILVCLITMTHAGLSDGHKQVTFYDKEQAKCLATNVYHESRGEPFEGQILVAKVTLNRAKTYQDICKEVYKHKQFSWTLNKRKYITDSVAYKKAFDAAHLAIWSDSECTHFHTQKVKPRWRRSLKICDSVGNHIFYN